MHTVTASEFQKEYGRLADEALANPVIIEKHHRPQLVLLSYKEYSALEQIKIHYEDTILKLRMDEAKRGEYVSIDEVIKLLKESKNKTF